MSLKNPKYPDCLQKQKVKALRKSHRDFVKKLQQIISSGDYSWGEIDYLSGKHKKDLHKIRNNQVFGFLINILKDIVGCLFLF